MADGDFARIEVSALACNDKTQGQARLCLVARAYLFRSRTEATRGAIL